MKTYDQKLKWIIAALVLVAAVVYLSPWRFASDDKAEDEVAVEGLIRLSPEQIEAGAFDIKPVQGKRLQAVASFPAIIVPDGDRYAHVVTEASGIVREVRKNLGEKVQKGDILAVLESRDMAEAKANYLAALRRETLAHETLKREQQLFSKRVSAEAEYHEAKNAADQSTIERDRTEQKLRAIGLSDARIAALSEKPSADLRLYELYAPFDGVVVERDISTGELLKADSEPFAIADLDKVWVEIGVPAKALEAIQAGQQMTVRGLACGTNRQSTALYVSPMIDSDTRTSKVIAELDNKDGCWRPGAFATVDVIVGTVDADIVVPKSAIQRIEDQEVVFVQHPEGVVARPVELGLSDQSDVQIVDGLLSDDSCATNNTFVLKSEILKEDEEE